MASLQSLEDTYLYMDLPIYPFNEQQCNQSNVELLNQTEDATRTTLFRCPFSWDSLYCWPPVNVNTLFEIPCIKIFEAAHIPYMANADDFDRKAYRICDENGNWQLMDESTTNYSECLSMIAEDQTRIDDKKDAIIAVGFILLIFASVSIVMLCVAMFIFSHFKNLESPSHRVHKNLMFALIINAVMLLIISFTPVFGFKFDAILCKIVLSSQMFSTLSSINWMFVEGLVLHSRVTTSVFRKKFPFKIYYLIGWGLPLTITLIWVYCMYTNVKLAETHCWNGYNDLVYIWLIKGPCLLVLMINLLFLINIIRIFFTRLRNTPSAELSKLRKTIRATILLIPLLGTTHLLFCFQPKNRTLFKAYNITNALFESTQGIFVSLFYCLLNNDVQNSIRVAIRKTSTTYANRRFSKHSTSIKCSSLKVFQNGRNIEDARYL